MISERREEPRHARSRAEPGDLGGVVPTLDQALAGLDGSHVGTGDTTARVLGARSPLVLQALMPVHGVRTEEQGDTRLLARAEVARIAGGAWVQGSRPTDRRHHITEAFGMDEPIRAAARIGAARYGVSEHTRDYPPLDAAGRHIYDGIDDLPGRMFLARRVAGTA